MISRRDILGIATVVGATVAGAGSMAPAEAGGARKRDKRRAQYQANSPEIQTFYRVNRYPAK